MQSQRYILALFFILIFITNGRSQGVQTYPLKSNPAIKKFLSEQPANSWENNNRLKKTGIKDTLSLPFFEDFTGAGIYPDSTRWTNNQVFINSGFPVSPPSLGVATFDGLDSRGNAYKDLNSDLHGPADTLTSQPFNLKTYRVGMTDVNYQLSDSVYLSFFYQPQGRGDVLNTRDSLVLQFLSLVNDTPRWVSVWRVPGMPLQPFRQAMVGIKSSSYLFSGFQFRFINYTSYSGNLNQWHLDYIRFSRNRSQKDTVINDITISQLPTSLLKSFQAMPWSHFIAAPAAERAATHSFRIKNLGKDTANIGLRHVSRNISGTILQDDPFANNNITLFPQKDTVWSFANFNFDTLSGSPVVINRTYSLFNAVNNDQPGNDNVMVPQVFDDHFAYDDGTAEAGFGLNYGGLPPSTQGKVAYRFHLNKPDTIRGISVFFSQIEESVRNKQFSLGVWKSITAGTPNENLLYKQDIFNPVYTDSINGYHYFELDTPVILPAGEFYIGWIQNSKFVLNVGWDMNYKVGGQALANPNIFFNLLGEWEPAGLVGTAMMRPHVGPEKIIVTSVPVKLKNEPFINIYPNPAKSSVGVSFEEENGYRYSLMDVSGRVLEEKEIFSGNSIDLSGYNDGTYFIRFVSAELGVVTKKIIVIR